MASCQWAVVEDVTQCSICTEVMRDPRVLPCQHSYCLECLLNYGSDKQPGDSIACPLCRKEFTIPTDGLSGTQKSHVITKLIKASTLSQGSILLIIFINDLVDVCEENIKMYLFAYGAKMFCSVF